MNAKADHAEAARRMALFASRHPPAVQDLARHAALPVALDPVLVQLLRTNFFLDLPGASLPATAEADLLLSNICREVGDGLFEMDPSVRDLLLRELAPERLREVATLLWQYTTRRAPWVDHPKLERAQQLTALGVLDPVRARRWLDEAEARPGRVGTEDKEWFVAMRQEMEQQSARRASSRHRFDAFLWHDVADRAPVQELAFRLMREGLKPWLARWELVPGEPVLPAVNRALDESAAFAVFIGPGGFGAWQDAEIWTEIDRRAKDLEHPFRVIPVLLPGAERPGPSQLPGFLTSVAWVEFRNTLDDPEAFQRLLGGIRGVEPGAGHGGPAFEGMNPYRGMEPFDVEDAPFFFGREAMTARLLDALRRTPSGIEHRFLAIGGPSVSGKSSLARAGLLAALKEGQLDGSAEWPMAICRPGAEPFVSLANALAGLAPASAAPEVFDRLQGRKAGDRSLHVATLLVLSLRPRGERLVVLVDQFEEVFSLCDDEAVRRDFIANLLLAASVEGGHTIVVLTMRNDFYPRCAAYAGLATILSDHLVPLGPMTRDELRQAIDRPARLVGLEPEPGLVKLLVDETRGQPGALPLLQLALQEVWRRREVHRLTIRAYREMGQLEGALRLKADAVYESLTPDQQALCRPLFLRLVQPSVDARRLVPLRELIPDDPERAGAVRALIDRLAGPESRLLMIVPAQSGVDGVFLEITHDALIRGWPRLREWIEAERESLRTRIHLDDAARHWAEADFDDREGRLYSGARLAEASEWAASHPDELGSLEAAFLSSSQEYERRNQAEEEEKLRSRQGRSSGSEDPRGKSTHGIVIGIRDYTDPGVPPLDSPVEDALRMVAWLVSRGKVPPDKLIVLLSPVVTQVDDSMPHLAETLGQLKLGRDQFNQVLKRLDALGNLRPALKYEILGALVNVDDAAPHGGERLYFYYAGHGLASRLRFRNEDAIVPANYHKGLHEAVSVSTISHYFQSLKFPQQLFFLDCCRNLLLEELDSAPLPRPLDLTRPMPDQFVYSASAPGLRAPDGRGLLTDALIDGLLGKGRAVDWVVQRRCYAVRAVRLFDYIRSRFATRPEPAEGDQAAGRNQVQEPRLWGEHNLEPILVTLSEAEVPSVTLTLIFSPAEARPIRRVTLMSSGVKHEYKDVARTPLTIELKPRTYFLEVEVDDPWLPDGDPGPWTLDVFESLEYAVTFIRKPVSGR